jgi:sulfite exporter TauE/SafE
MKDWIRMFVCSIIGFMLIDVGIRTPPLSFLFTVAGIFLIIYGFSPGKAQTVIKELGEIAKKLIDGIFGR